MQTMPFRRIVQLLLMLATIPSAMASISTPPVVAVDGAEFSKTGSLVTARNNHTATLLPGGKVLVTGGFGENDALDSAELYDPSTGRWTATGRLADARYHHTATLLENGKVLVTGGHGTSSPLSSSELYDPATGLWTGTGNLTTARYHHTATLLENGKVLATAGFNYLVGDYLGSAEIYDPSTGLWTATGGLATPRFVHTTTLLPGGKVLAVGGSDSGYLGSAELYNPETGRWSGTGGLLEARYIHSASLLANGKVLVAGGYGENFYLNSTELFDPGTGQWSATDGLTDARYGQTGVLLPDGSVLVTGGNAFDGSLASSEIYQSNRSAWTAAASLNIARFNHTAIVLGDGSVLVAGGYGDGGILASAEIRPPGMETSAVAEGALLNRTGTFSDPDGNATVTLTASTGTVVANNVSGTWSWTGTATDGPGTLVVMITATDDSGSAVGTDFTLAVSNSPPVTVITAPSAADEDTPVAFSFTATDPGSLDQAADFTWSVNYGDGSGLPSVPDTSPLSLTHAFSNPGNYTVTVSATDKDGAPSLVANHTIAVADVTPPIIEIHSNVGPIEATGPGGAVVNFEAAAATDNSGQAPASITYSQDSGTVFSVGTTPVTITATDAAGNSSQSSFNVTVVDTIPPLASPPADGFNPLALTNATLQDYTSQLLTSDLVGVALVTQTPPAGTAISAGTTSVTLVARDAAGNPSLPVDFEVTLASPGLVNGSFEAGYEGWTFSGNQSIQSTPPYQATDGTRLVSFNDINRAANGVLSQTFPTLPGEIYQLDFDMGVLAYNGSQQRLGVELTGNTNRFSQSFTIRSPGILVRWESQSLRFQADSSATTLVFRDLSPATVSIDLTLDHVRLTPLVSRTLTIASSPGAGARITVSPPDNDAMANGVSNFTRRYLEGTTVSLTAASANNGFRFQKWLRNGADLSNDPVVSFLMDGNLTLTAVYADGPPVIIKQPTARAVAVGETTTLSVTAEGTGTLAYQWRLGGADIQGATDSNYTISNMRSDDAGNYDVVVSNANGAVTSDVAAVSLVASTLVNGSFEQGYVGWAFTGNQLLAESAPYAAVDGIRLVAFNPTNSTPNGSLSQTFATTPGRSYALDFSVGVLSYQASPQELQVVVSGTGTLLSRTIGLTGTSGGSIRWFPRSFTFIANSPTSTLVFNDRSPVTRSIDLLLDHVRVSEGTVVPNTAPVALDDSYFTIRNTPLVVPAPGVISNDSDADSSPLTVSINTLPANGVVSLNSNGGFTYTPNDGFTGRDSFTYRANDGGLDSNIATVDVEVSPPSIQLLFNGGFEANFTGWVTSGNQFIQSGAPYAATEGSKLASFNPGNRTPDAVLSQPIATIPGRSYTLAFDLGVLAYNTSTQTMRVSVTGTGGLLSQSITLTGTGDGRNRWLAQSFTFVADSSVSTLTFRDLSASTNAIDLMLDNVRVTGVSNFVLASPALVSVKPDIPAAAALTVTPQPVGEMGTASLAGTPGDFTVRMAAADAGVYVLERSSDLVHWRYLDERLVSAPGFVEFHDAERLPEIRHFYRIGRRP